MGLLTWSTTAADNDDADATINWLEDQDPSTVNNSARAMMARLANVLRILGGALATTGSANSYVLTTGLSGTTTLTEPLFGMFTANHTNTGAATLAVDGLTAKSMKRSNGDALAAGDITSGCNYLWAYELTADVIYVLNAIPGATDAEARAGESESKFLTPSNLSQRAVFHADKNSTQQTGIVSATNTKVTFTSEAFDLGSHYDTSTSRWTPPSGAVRIGASVDITAASVADGDRFILMVYKNGALLFYLDDAHTSSASMITLSGSIMDYALGTDYYEIYVHCVSSGDSVIDGDENQCWFQGEQI